MHISRPKGNEKNATRYFDSNNAESMEYNPSRRTGREVLGKMNKDDLDRSMNESINRDSYDHPITRMQSPPILTRPTIGTTYIYSTGGSRSPMRPSVMSRNNFEEGDRRTMLVTAPKREEMNLAGEYDKRRSPVRGNNEILLDQPMKHFQDDNRQTHIDYGHKFEVEKNMSPNKNYDFNVSYEDRKRVGDLRMTKYIDADGNYVEGYDYEQVEGSKTFNPKLRKGYDPINKKEGKLINRELKTLKPVDETAPERRTHFQKMKKLSTIILSKNERTSHDEGDRTLRRTIGERKTFNPAGRSPTSNNNKFIRVTMAMLSSKGPNCEDKLITRLMRYEKGGVVDLAQQANKQKNKYEVKKVRTRSNNKSTSNKIYNPKDRVKAAQFIQGWWRDILYKYKFVTDKIIRIQSYWRGHWLRRYVYDIFYSIIILNAFCDKIKTPMQRIARLSFFETLRNGPTLIDYFSPNQNGYDSTNHFNSNNQNTYPIGSNPDVGTEEEKLAYELHRTILKGLTNLYANKLRLYKVRCLYHWLLQTRVSPEIAQKTRCFSALRLMNVSKTAQYNRVRRCFRLWAKVSTQKMIKELSEEKGLKENELLKKDNELLKRDNELLNKENELKKKENELIQKEKELKDNNEIFKKEDELINKENELKKKENDLIKKEKELKDNNQIFKKEDELLNKENELNKKETELNRKEKLTSNELNKKEDELLNRENELLNKENELLNKEKELKDNNLIFKKEDYLLNKEYELNKKENELFKKEKELKDNNHIYKKEDELLNKENELKKKENELLNKEKDLKDNNLIFKKEDELLNKENELKKKENELLKKEKELANNESFKGENDQLNKENNLKNKAKELTDNNELLTKEDELLNKENELKRKENELMKKENLLKDNNELFKKEDELLNKENELKRKENELMKKEKELKDKETRNAKDSTEQGKGRSEEEKLLNDLHRGILKGMTNLYGNKIRLLKVRSLYHWLLQIRPSSELIEKTRCMSALRLMKVSKNAQKNRLIKSVRFWAKLCSKQKAAENEIELEKIKEMENTLKQENEKLKEKENAIEQEKEKLKQKKKLLENTNNKKSRAREQELKKEIEQLQNGINQRENELEKEIHLKEKELEQMEKELDKKKARQSVYKPIEEPPRDKAEEEKLLNELHRSILKGLHTTYGNKLKWLKVRSLYHWLLQVRPSPELAEKTRCMSALRIMNVSKTAHNNRLRNCLRLWSKLSTKKILMTPTEEKDMMKADFVSKILGRTLKSRLRKDVNDTLRSRFNKWKKFVKLGDNVPKLLKLLRIDAFRRSLSPVLMNKKLAKLKNERLKDVFSLSRNSFFRKLLHYFLLWNNNLKTSGYKNKLKAKVMDNIFRRTEKTRLLKYFLKWRFVKSNESNNSYISIVIPTDENQIVNTENSIESKKQQPKQSLKPEKFGEKIIGQDKNKKPSRVQAGQVKTPKTIGLINQKNENEQEDPLTTLLHKYADELRENLITRPISKLAEGLRAWYMLKKNKASTVQDFCKGILGVLERMKIMNRSKQLFMLFNKYNKKSSINFRSSFIRWRRINKWLDSNNLSKVIQSFVRTRRDKFNKKLEKLERTSEIVKDHFKKDLIIKLKMKSLLFKRRRILLRLMKELPPEVRFEFLKRYFNRWRNSNVHMKKSNASILLVARLKGFITRRFRDLLFKRKARMNDLVMKLFGKYLDMRRLCFNKWILNSKRKNLAEAARTIQKFLREGVQNSLQDQAKNKVKEMFKKLVMKRLAAAMKKAGAIADKSKAQTLKNALYYCVKKPFQKLVDELTLKSRMKTMNKVLNKVKTAFRHYWLPYYLRKWKSNTWDYIMPLLIKLQQMIKSKLIYWKLRAQYKKSNLLTRFLLGMTRDNDLKKRLALHLWAKAVKLGQIQDKISNVQARLRGNLTRNKAEKDLAKNRMSNLMKKLAKRKLADNLTEVADYVLPIKNALQNMGQLEKRYSINNMFAFGKNALRNLYFFKMTNKRCFDNNLANLRLFFDKWVRFVKKMDNAVNILQRNSRKRLAIRKKHGLEKLRDRLKALFFKVAGSNTEKLQMAIYIWRRNAKLDFIDEKVRHIQSLFRFNLAKRRAERLKKYKNSLDQFEKKLVGVAYRDFINQLHKNKQFDKIRFFFLKKFHSLDNQFKKLYMMKYLEDWKKRAHRLKNQESGASYYLTARIKGFLVRRFIKLMLARKNKLNALLLRLFIKHNSKLDVYFYLWRSINRRLKLNENAKTIQNFVSGLMPTFQDKAKQRRYNELSKGFEPVRRAMTMAATGKPFKQLKDYSKENGIRKFFTKLADKRRRMIENGFNKVRDEANDRRAKRLAAASDIQKIYRLHKQRTGIWGLIVKIKKLRMILNMMKNKDLRYLFVAFKNWKRVAHVHHIHNQAKVIQKFLKENIMPAINDKINEAKKGLQNLLTTHNNKKRNDILKGLLNLAKFMKLKLNIRKKILNRLNQNTLERQKLKYLSKLTKLPKTLALRVLKFWMDKWRTTARYLTEQQERADAISDRLKDLWLRYVSKYQDATGAFLRLWLRQANKIKMVDSASVIQKFIRDKLYKLLNRNRWMRFAYGLYLKNGKLTGYEIIRRMRIMKGLDKVSKYYRDNLLALGWKDFISNLRDSNAMRLIKLIFGNFEKRKEIVMKDYGFRTWLDKIARMKRKEQGCERITKALTLRHATDSAEVLGSVFIVKKLLRLIRLIQLKGVFDRIKEKRDNIIIMKNNLLVFDKCDEQLLQFNKKTFVDRLYKLYVFKRLLKMMNCFDRYTNGPLKLSLYRELFNELYNRYADKVQFNNTMGGQLKKEEIKSQPFKFNKKTQNPKKVQSSKLQRSPYKYAVPHLVNRLNKLQKDNNKSALNSIKLYVFSMLMTKYSKTRSIKPLLSELRAHYDHLQSIPALKERLRGLLHRYFVRLIGDKLKEASKVNQLSYLFKLSIMHKDIAKKHFLREIIRKWKFVSFMKKIAKRKMEAMYKTMHLNYLSMANEVFGDEEHGLIKEFEIFGNSIGMFTNEDLETYEETKKKFYRTVKKRYIFEAAEIGTDDEKYDSN
jgi:hypothetical protein